MAATQSPPFNQIPLGSSVPALTSHAISVSLPLWEDNVGYEEGDKRVVDKMETGYPRFFIHRSIQKLAALCLAKFGQTDESCMLFPSPRVSAEARDFLAAQQPAIPSRVVEYVLCPGANSLPTASTSVAAIDCIELQILLFNKEHFPYAKQFWQHTGDGVSSRMAERALAFLGEAPAGTNATAGATAQVQPASRGFSRNRHYGRATHPHVGSSAGPSSAAQAISSGSSTPLRAGGPSVSVPEEVASADLATYLEERYGRNLPLFNAPLAKQALKRRIAGGLLPSDEEFGERSEIARGITEDDIYLYPGGMSAIWHAHKVARLARTRSGGKEGKSICFGFPYTDTLKILNKWGQGCHFYGNGTNAELDEFEAYLESQDKSAPVLALFCEFPSNPLLRCADMPRLRKLADKHGFVIVIDETIGNFINVDVMPYADILVSSLTKIFSGDSNVMGGSLIVNPNSPKYADLKAALAEDYEDNYYPEDAVYMERNSRDYRSRIKRVNDNAYAVTDYLFSRSLMDTTSPAAGKAVKRIYYPRWETPELYAQCQRLPTTGKGGFGGLFSVTFTSMAASVAFYDALACAKGPSLGTSFTLASPYAILAHYLELDWAAEYGVEAGLVRISVGQEESSLLLAMIRESVKAAEAAVAEEED